MALEDYLEPEVAVTAVVTATLFSPRARQLLRRGVVYGLAGILTAGDALATLARSVGQGMQEAGGAAVHASQQAPGQAKTPTEDAGGQT